LILIATGVTIHILCIQTLKRWEGGWKIYWYLKKGKKASGSKIP
jgi:hypothetical protein